MRSGRAGFKILSQGPAEQTESRKLYSEGVALDRDTMRFFGASYLRSKEDALDWRVSPLRAPGLRGLPPALVITAECDPLCDDGRLYARCSVLESVTTIATQI